MKFSDFNLSDEVLKALEEIDYKEPAYVQETTIPEILSGRDVLIIEATGKGKTASFGIPICENIKWEINAPQALVIVPTRELAIQVGKEIESIGRYKKVSVQVIYGKQSYENERLLLKQKSHVIVATVGRLFDHISKETIDLSQVKYFVMDEFDELTKPGFIEKVDSIIEVLPLERQNIFVSATIPENVGQILNRYLDNAYVFNYLTDTESQHIDRNSEPEIDQFVLYVSDKNRSLYVDSMKSDFEKRMELIKNILVKENTFKSIIFCNTQAMTDKIYNSLKEYVQTSYKIHGDMPQKERVKAINDFKSYKRAILVSTNVTARGIDIDDVDTVINYEAPFESEKYVHRIGRTARAGKTGKAITLISSSDINLMSKEETKLNYSELKVYDASFDDDVRTYFRSYNIANPNRINREKKQADVTKIYFRGGKNKKLRTTDFVGLLCNVDGVLFDDIGVIKVGKEYTIIDILNNKADLILQESSNLKIKGKKIYTRVAKHQE
ncbi:DEAD/DEAH box helicase [Proteocatella sphenisci]|uniref:DEAD/DEAH box helicase n=1 Tax=Proteocatella sphenisci TaxID=181070 RepID=UPI00048C8C23|nr:DEAD/DEAH box helicase [Proteocatella sphenisci]